MYQNIMHNYKFLYNSSYVYLGVLVTEYLDFHFKWIIISKCHISHQCTHKNYNRFAAVDRRSLTIASYRASLNANRNAAVITL